MPAGVSYNCHVANVTNAPWLTVNPADETPIHEQIEERIRLAIARGQLDAGDRLPAIRDAARAGFNEMAVTADRLKELAGDEVELKAGVMADECRKLFLEWRGKAY